MVYLIYPLVNVHNYGKSQVLMGKSTIYIPKTMERSTMLLMGKSTISMAMASIANC
jgi:hypothetical protein